MEHGIRQRLVAAYALTDDRRPVATADLVRYLSRIQATTATLITTLAEQAPNVQLTAEQKAVLRYVDECVDDLLHMIDPGSRIERMVRRLAPLVAAGYLSGSSTRHLLTLLGLVLREGVGWSEDLGVLGDKFINPFEVQCVELHRGRMTVDRCLAVLTRHVESRRQDAMRRERQLKREALEELGEAKCRHDAATALNRCLDGKHVPMFGLIALQGVWFEVLQTIVRTYSTGSKEWDQVVELTESLVKSLTPGGTDRLRSQLPTRIRRWRREVSLGTIDVDGLLHDIEAEYRNLGNKPDMSLCTAQPVASDKLFSDKAIPHSHPLRAIQPGQWISYTPPGAPAEKTAKLLVLVNWEQAGIIVVTNHNRRRSLRLSYADLARSLEVGTSKLLPLSISVKDAFETHLSGLLSAPERHVPLTAALGGIHKESRLQRAIRTRHLRRKARRKLALAVQTVESLDAGAWIGLPLMKGTLTPCRLATKVNGGDTLVFCNRQGIKVAELSPGQLANLIVTENSRILDTGDEFAKVLESVVRDQRSRRSGAFIEATGT